LAGPQQSLLNRTKNRLRLRPFRRKSTESFHTQNVAAGHNFIAPEAECVLKPCSAEMPKEKK